MTRARDVANVLTAANVLATDVETAAAVSNHSSASDPHGDRAAATTAISAHATTANGHIPSQTGNAGKFLKTDGSSASWATSGLTTVSINSNQTLAINYRYLVDTTAARTLTLPASPSVGDEIQIFDASGTAATYNITINNNSLKINGSVQTAVIDVNAGAAALVYTGSTYGWRFP